MYTSVKKMGQKAFTLVELIIVIVIVGILAAISIVGYQAVVDRAEEESARTTLQTADREIRALMAFETAASGTISLPVSGTLSADLAAIDVTVDDSDGSNTVTDGDEIRYDADGDGTADWKMELTGSATLPADNFGAHTP